MNIIIYIIAGLIVSTLLWFITRKKSKPQPTDTTEENLQPDPQQTSPGSSGIRRRQGRGRIQRELQRQQEEKEQQQQQQQEKDEESSSEEDIKKPVKKIGVKKQKKLQLKEEKRLAREAAEREREEKKAEDEKREQVRLKQEQKEKLEEERKAAELQRQKEEQERREHEEYLKLIQSFEVEEEGMEREISDEETDHQLEEFIAYIKETKVLFLEDLASHFGLRVQDAIDRVQDLLKDGSLTGVIDDRGKFIYITMDELKAVANFIERRGRVSISDIARASNSLINVQRESELKLST